MNARDTATRLCLGLLWFGLSSGLIVMFVFLGRGSSTAIHSATLIPGILILVALAARWVLIPRFTSLPPLIVTYIVGLAVAHAAGVYSIFFGGKFIREVIYLVIATMLTYLPVFRLPQKEPNHPPQPTPGLAPRRG